MAFTITEAFVQQYRSNVIALYQQSTSKFRGTVREESVNGESHFFERLGATAAVERTTRHADTPLVESVHSRRMVTMADKEWADLVDQQDKIRLLISPESEYVRSAVKALNRAFDDVVIAAFTADAKTGKTGSTSLTFAADWPATRSGTDGDWDFTGAALTLANILKVKKDLDENEVDEDGRYIAISPAGLEQLLKQSTTPNFTSSDYQMVKALVNGEINTALGFTWIKTNRLPLDPADATRHFCFAWHRDAVGVAMGKDITTRVSERADKSYAVQPYACLTMGATRIQGEGVVRFKIDQDN